EPRLSPTTRAIVIRSASTDRTAERAFSARRKKTMLTARTTFAVMVSPNQAMNSGASAMRGTLLIGARNGPKIELRVGLRPRIRPARVPETEPMTKETPTAPPVSLIDWMLRSDGRYSSIAVQTPLGRPNRVSSSNPRLEVSSHKARKATQIRTRVMLMNVFDRQKTGRFSLPAVPLPPGAGAAAGCSVVMVMAASARLPRAPVADRAFEPLKQ